MSRFSRMGPVAWLFATTLLIVVAFAGSTFYVGRLARSIDGMAADIAGNADPSIRYLAAARTELHEITSTLTTSVIDGRAVGPSLRARIGEHREHMRAALSAYTALPFFPTEPDRWREVERDIDEAEADEDAMVSRLERGDVNGAAELRAGPVVASAARADVELERLIAFNVDEASRLSLAIADVRGRAQSAAVLLDGLTIMLAVAVLGAAMSATRAHVRALREARDAESAMTKKLETVADAAVSIAESVTRNACVDDVVQATANAARSVADADTAALRIGADRARPNDPRARGACLDVPVRRESETIGHLYLAKKPGQAPFGEQDQRAIELLATIAATAVHSAKLHEDLRQAVRAREDVVSIVSHDLRNPLAVVGMASGLLRREVGADSAARRHADTIARNVARMERLIVDLLTASRVQEGKLTIDPRAQDAGALMTEVVDEHAVIAANAGIDLRVEVEGSLPPVICDRDRIVQVLSNLVGNALKFTARGGSIVVSARSEGRDIAFSVRDTGIGISEEAARHVFDRYWQDDELKSRGTGLGLYIAKGIIESHRGRIWVTSRLGEGSDFRFTLPAADASFDAGCDPLGHAEAQL